MFYCGVQGYPWTAAFRPVQPALNGTATHPLPTPRIRRETARKANFRVRHTGLAAVRRCPAAPDLARAVAARPCAPRQRRGVRRPGQRGTAKRSADEVEL